jgi:hypothetical protein
MTRLSERNLEWKKRNTVSTNADENNRFNVRNQKQVWSANKDRSYANFMNPNNKTKSLKINVADFNDKTDHLIYEVKKFYIFNCSSR